MFKSEPSKICGRQPLKNLKRYGLLKQTISFKFFKGCLLQILLGPLLNTLFQITFTVRAKVLVGVVVTVGAAIMVTELASVTS